MNVIRGNLVGTNQRPENVLVRATDLTPEQQEQTRNNIGACSLMDVVDKLCPSFTESGAVVTCEPVEGYPLAVEWQKKNLFNEVAWHESHGFTLQEDGSWYCSTLSETCFTNAEKRPGSMYLTATMKTDVETTPFYLIAYYTDGTMSTTLAVNKGENTFVTKTLTTDSAKTVDYIKWTYGGAGSYYLKNVMISFVDHVYEPYAETANITRCGKNLIDMNDWVKNGCATIAEDGSYHVDVLSMYNTYGRPETGKYLYKPENGSIPLVCTATAKKDSTVETGGCFGVVFYYTDGTKDSHSNYGSIVNGESVYFTKTFKSDPNKIIDRVGFSWCNYNAWVKDVQLECGTVATAYEPYKTSETFTIGEQIPALPGSNTIFADSGIVTVSGKTNPAAEIEKLKNAILAMGANV